MIFFTDFNILMLTAVNIHMELVHFIITLFIFLSHLISHDMQDYVFCVSALKITDSWCMWWQKMLWCAFCIYVAKEKHADMLGFLNTMHNLGRNHLYYIMLIVH